MSKQQEWSLLVPGPLGWEIWKRQADGAFERVQGGEEPMKPAELKDLPGGDLMLLFPVRAFHSLPFRAESTDKALFEDLATMHAERLGIRPDPMAGKLYDHFKVGGDDQSTVLHHVVLKKPGEGDLPLRTPKEFDLSPRAYPVEGDALCVWKELGRWVFAFHRGGELLYCQSTLSTSEAPDASVLQEIRLALGQLAMQGLKAEPSTVYVWPPEGELGEAGALADAFARKPQVGPRPAPVMPDPFSDLLPEDVRAARVARQQRNQRFVLVGLVLLAYLGLIGWLGYGLWEKTQERKGLQAELDELQAGTAGILEEHNVRWTELGEVVQPRLSPLEIMLAIQKAVPRNSGLRLTTADINLAEGSIQVLGTAPQSAPITQFYGAIKRSPDLSWLDWEEEPPAKDQQGWKLRIRTELPKVQ